MTLGKQSRPNETAELSVSSAYIFWRTFVDRNISIGHLNILKDYSHDIDLANYIQHLINDYQKEIDLLTSMLNKYSINSPDPSPKDSNIMSNTTSMLDQEIAEVIYRFMRLDVNVLLLSLRYTSTNDMILETTIKLSKKALSRIDTFIKYGKIKNWLYFPPLYPSISKNATDQAAVNEIFLLWDHLVYKYTITRQIQIYLLYIKDKELKSLLVTLLKKQKNESKRLEDKLLYFGVVLPQAYLDETIKPSSSENIDERLIFNSFLHVLQNRVSLHGAALQEVIVNDNLREYFIKITNEEINMMVRFLKLGRLKGWANIIPGYLPQ